MEEIAQDKINDVVKFATTPSWLREEIFGVNSVSDYCNKTGIPRSTYYWLLSNDDTIKDVIKKALTSAKGYVMEILDSLGQKAASGDSKSQELYIKYILQLAEKLDHTSDGKPILYLNGIIAEKNGITQKPSNDSTGQS